MQKHTISMRSQKIEFYCWITKNKPDKYRIKHLAKDHLIWKCNHQRKSLVNDHLIWKFNHQHKSLNVLLSWHQLPLDALLPWQEFYRYPCLLPVLMPERFPLQWFLRNFLCSDFDTKNKHIGSQKTVKGTCQQGHASHTSNVCFNTCSTKPDCISEPKLFKTLKH